jgi:hypothetical protein
MSGPEDAYNGLLTEDREPEDVGWGGLPTPDDDFEEPDVLSGFRSWLDDPE